MRTTLRIDDDLMRVLEERACRENVSVTSLVNRLLRRALDLAGRAKKKGNATSYRERAFAMGEPRIDLTKALAAAAALEDAEIVEKSSRRK
ncbi:MAG: ribbon-helix-helix protein, CopG family [Pirellulales bacterium]